MPIWPSSSFLFLDGSSNRVEAGSSNRVEAGTDLEALDDFSITVVAFEARDRQDVVTHPGICILVLFFNFFSCMSSFIV